MCVGGVQAQETSYFRVERAHAACLRENALRYSAMEPIVIDLSLCPNLTASTDLSEASMNSFVPSLPVEGSTTKVDRYVAYSPAQLVCLSKLTIDDTSETIQLPKDPKC